MIKLYLVDWILIGAAVVGWVWMLVHIAKKRVR